MRPARRAASALCSGRIQLPHPLHGHRRRRGARFHAQLLVDALQVFFHRRRAAAQDVADVAVGLALGHPVQHFAFAQRQAEGDSPELYPAYAAEMKKLAGPGCAIADVTTVWTTLLEHKGVLDLSGNGLNHPNDFGHRIYADVVIELIAGPR